MISSILLPKGHGQGMSHMGQALRITGTTTHTHTLHGVITPVIITLFCVSLLARDGNSKRRDFGVEIYTDRRSSESYLAEKLMNFGYVEIVVVVAGVKVYRTLGSFFFNIYCL